MAPVVTRTRLPTAFNHWWFFPFTANAVLFIVNLTQNCTWVLFIKQERRLCHCFQHPLPLSLSLSRVKQGTLTRMLESAVHLCVLTA